MMDAALTLAWGMNGQAPCQESLPAPGQLPDTMRFGNPFNAFLMHLRSAMGTRQPMEILPLPGLPQLPPQGQGHPEAPTMPLPAQPFDPESLLEDIHKATETLQGLLQTATPTVKEAIAHLLAHLNTLQNQLTAQLPNPDTVPNPEPVCPKAPQEKVQPDRPFLPQLFHPVAMCFKPGRFSPCEGIQNKDPEISLETEVSELQDVPEAAVLPETLETDLPKEIPMSVPQDVLPSTMTPMQPMDNAGLAQAEETNTPPGIKIISETQTSSVSSQVHLEHNAQGIVLKTTAKITAPVENKDMQIAHHTEVRIEKHSDTPAQLETIATHGLHQQDSPKPTVVLDVPGHATALLRSNKQTVIQHLESLVEKLPEQAQTALQEVVAKLQAQTLEKPVTKSIQQMQLEFCLHPKHSVKLHEAHPKHPVPLEQPETMPQAIVPAETLPAESRVSLEALPAETAFSSVETTLDTQANPIQPQTSARPAQDKAAGVPFKIHQAPHEQVVEAARLTINAGHKTITLHLKPEALGHVRLMLNSNQHQEITARLITETLEAKEALEKSLQELCRSLESNGLRIGNISVTQAGAGELSSDSQSFQSFNGNAEQRWDAMAQSQSQSHNQQSSQQESQNALFASLGSNTFKDGGSSPRGDEASSSRSFDTDVEGEEVALTAASTQAALHEGAVDIRI